MSTEEMTQPHPAEQAGVLVGRAYAAAVAALATSIRKPAAPTWHWRAAHRAGAVVRDVAGRGAEVVEVRARTAPRRLVAGLKRLWHAARKAQWKTIGTRVGAGGFLGWWGWSWATEAGVPLRPVLWAATGAGLVVAYAAGSEPAKRPVTRREKARQRAAIRAQHAAVRAFVGAVHRMLHDRSGLHLADLADQITARSKAHGRPLDCTVASLRALLEPLGVPIRDQLVIDGTNRPGIHAGDWRVWHVRHHPTTTPAEPPREEPPATPTREGALPHAESPDETDPLGDTKPQASDSGLEISGQDLDQDDPPGEEPPLSYTAEQLRLLEHTRTAIGTARGAHLRDIPAVAQAAGDYPDWSVTRLRRALDELGVQVEDKLWLNGGNTRGVLATSLPPLPALDQETS
ncbi:hypothetical protein [Streptomyces sp. 6-11-2]|uniref:hypothetical protein n=1 Tax=Streptomyces sp. 6-11-2 TaxID=2585753 RepID=UPI001143CD5F|nr:hypothetical protein [Streptomyces sp. 6-11-2]GED89327.1 hypothetical protein TNCT6_64120 [Streptomyces sp. 6-11-2]